MFPLTRVPFWVPMFDPQPYRDCEGTAAALSNHLIELGVAKANISSELNFTSHETVRKGPLALRGLGGLFGFQIFHCNKLMVSGKSLVGMPSQSENHGCLPSRKPSPVSWLHFREADLSYFGSSEGHIFEAGRFFGGCSLFFVALKGSHKANPTFWEVYNRDAPSCRLFPSGLVGRFRS